MRTPLITHGDPTPVLESAKHNFYFVPLLIEIFIINYRLFSVLFGRNAGRDASPEQCGTKPIRIIPAIPKKLPSLRQGIQKYFCTLVITYLTFCEHKGKRFALSIAKSMELCVQSPSCASDAAGKSPFLSKLAAVL